MKQYPIELDFGSFVLTATLFNTEIARKFLEILPRRVILSKWGDELYGPLGVDLGDENPMDKIPPGGLAYTNQGKYLCIFFGQTPAWPVEYIGRIDGNQWQRLLTETNTDSVIVNNIG